MHTNWQVHLTFSCWFPLATSRWISNRSQIFLFNTCISIIFSTTIQNVRCESIRDFSFYLRTVEENVSKYKQWHILAFLTCTSFDMFFGVPLHVSVCVCVRTCVCIKCHFSSWNLVLVSCVHDAASSDFYRTTIWKSQAKENQPCGRLADGTSDI